MNTLNYVLGKYGLRGNRKTVVKLNITRNDLATLFKELGFAVGVEIGVEKGDYSKILSKANPGVKLFCIDPWKVYRRWNEEKNQEVLDKNFKITKKRLTPYNCEVIRKSSTGALTDFAPKTLDFVYIDGNHTFDYVWEDLNGWSKVVKAGGIVSGHDYRSRHKEHNGVTVAVDKYIKEHSLKLFTTVKGGQSSWFFVNK